MTARIVNNLQQFIDSVERKTARAMTAAIVRGASELPALTPVDTSTLLNSQYRNVSKRPAGGVVGTVGFTAEYAAAVHAASGKLKGLPRPKRDGKTQGVYWGPHDGRPKFLALSFERAQPDINAILTGALRV